MIIRDSDVSFQGALWGDEPIPEGSLVVMAEGDEYGDVVPLRQYDPILRNDSVSTIVGVTLDRARYPFDPIRVGNRPGALYSIRVTAPSLRGETIGPSLSGLGLAVSIANPIMTFGVSLGETSRCSNGDAMAKVLWLGTANAGLSASSDYATLSVGQRLIALLGEGTDGFDGVFPIITEDPIYLGDSNNPWSTVFAERIHLGMNIVYPQPTVAPNAAAGAGATATLLAGSNNSRGRIILTAGVGPTIGSQLTLTYGAPWPVISGVTAPKAMITPASASASAVQSYVGSVASGFQLLFNVAPVNTTTYFFDYFVCG